MKKVFPLAILFLFSFVFVFAGTCDDDQTIMRLYQSSNSHVSFWNESVADYTFEICYDEIFGEKYIGANPHQCTDSNRVFSLYNTSNSHASEINDVYYTEDVCYGDLVCEYDTTAGSGCANNGEVIARMYSDYNSHVSSSSDVGYTIKVCCASSSIYWADMSGNLITQADAGDTVQMIYKGGTAGDMIIKEKDIIGDDDIRIVSGELKDGLVIGFWEITDGDLLKTTDYGDFYFEINGEKSESLEVLLNGDDDPTNVNLTSPSCGSYYDKDTNLSISISISDDDDLINGSLKIGKDVIETFQNGDHVFNHVFDSPGDFSVVLETTGGRGGKSRDISNIMILDKDVGGYIDGEYVAACILKPFDYSEIKESVVDFDASTTRGINVTGGVLKVLKPEDGAVFSWYWNFRPEDRDRILEDTSNPFAYKFTKVFPIAGINSAHLRVEI